MDSFVVTHEENAEVYARIYTLGAIGQWVPQFIAPIYCYDLVAQWAFNHGIRSGQTVSFDYPSDVHVLHPGRFFQHSLETEPPDIDECYKRALGHSPQIETPQDMLVCTAGLTRYIAQSLGQA